MTALKRLTGLTVFLPSHNEEGNVERVVAGFNEAYAIDDSYRTKHHGAAMLPPDAVDLVAVPVVIPADTTTVAPNANQRPRPLVDRLVLTKSTLTPGQALGVRFRQVVSISLRDDVEPPP